MAELGTVGERLVGRRLEKEKRAGVTHYVTGQLAVQIEHVFDMDTNEDLGWAGLVSWVDAMGQARILVVDYEDGVWHPIMHASAGQTTMRAWMPADEMTLTETMLAALVSDYDKAIAKEAENDA